MGYGGRRGVGPEPSPSKDVSLCRGQPPAGRFLPRSFPPAPKAQAGEKREREGGQTTPPPSLGPLASSWAVLGHSPAGQPPRGLAGGEGGGGCWLFPSLIYPKKAGGANSGGQGPPPSKRPPGRKLGHAKKPGERSTDRGGGLGPYLRGGAPPQPCRRLKLSPSPLGGAGPCRICAICILGLLAVWPAWRAVGGGIFCCFNPKNLKTYCTKRQKCLYSIKRKSGVICAKNLKAGTWILS